MGNDCKTLGTLFRPIMRSERAAYDLHTCIRLLRSGLENRSSLTRSASALGRALVFATADDLDRYNVLAESEASADNFERDVDRLFFVVAELCRKLNFFSLSLLGEFEE